MSTGSARWNATFSTTARPTRKQPEAPSSSCASCWIPDWFKNYYEDKDGIYENDVIGKSELGDYSTMRDFYTTDCTWYRHENGLTK